MEDIGFILSTYVITFVTVGAMAWRVIRRGKALAAQVPDEDQPWT